MKTPEEIIDDVWIDAEDAPGYDVRKALDAAGYAIVPKEPTVEMLSDDGVIRSNERYYWQRLLTAAQKKPAESQD